MNMPDEEFSDIIKPKGPRYRYIHRILAILLQCTNYIPLKAYVSIYSSMKLLKQLWSAPFF